MRKLVVLPAPFGPSRPTTSPCATSNATPLTTCRRPYHFSRSRTSSSGHGSILLDRGRVSGAIPVPERELAYDAHPTGLNPQRIHFIRSKYGRNGTAGCRGRARDVGPERHAVRPVDEERLADQQLPRALPSSDVRRHPPRSRPGRLAARRGCPCCGGCCRRTSCNGRPGSRNRGTRPRPGPGNPRGSESVVRIPSSQAGAVVVPVIRILGVINIACQAQGRSPRPRRCGRRRRRVSGRRRWAEDGPRSNSLPSS